MDWTNERYVRLFVRDTTTWKRIGWDGQCVLMQLLRRVDRSGVLPLDDLEPWECVMLHTGAPEDSARRGMDALLRVGTFEVRGTHLVMPNYLEAQECVKSDALRAKEYRERRSASNFVTNRDDMESQIVTQPSQVDRARHAASRGVTPSLAFPSEPSEPGQAEPSQAKPSEIAAGSASATAKRRKVTTHVPASSDVWQAYAEAYQARYGTAPVRNAKSNSLVKAFVGRVAASEAPGVARHYLASQNARYVASGHSLGCMLQDAEKLRTEWATGRMGTGYGAHQADKSAGRMAAHLQAMAELRAEDEADEAERAIGQ